MNKHPKHDPKPKEQQWFEKLIRLRRHYESTLPELEKRRKAHQKAKADFEHTQRWSMGAYNELALHISAATRDGSAVEAGLGMACY